MMSLASLVLLGRGGKWDDRLFAIWLCVLGVWGAISYVYRDELRTKFGLKRATINGPPVRGDTCLVIVAILLLAFVAWIVIYYFQMGQA